MTLYIKHGAIRKLINTDVITSMLSELQSKVFENMNKCLKDNVHTCYHLLEEQIILLMNH